MQNKFFNAFFSKKIVSLRKNTGNMADKRLLILITNDDGVQAPGLKSLAECAAGKGDIVVVAPERPQSGMSSAITVGSALKVNAHPDMGPARVFSVGGTPTDCVKLAMHTILPRRPDLILSGVNHGSNAGTSITYSGTMGAVMEGCMAGIPSVGFSLLHHSLKADFSLSSPLVSDIIDTIIAHGLPDYVALNVNIPALIAPKGAKTCRAARGYWTDEYQRYLDPSGDPFYWLTGKFVNAEPEATDTDEYWLAQGYASVVPCTPDQTASAQIAAMAPLFDR